MDNKLGMTGVNDQIQPESMENSNNELILPFKRRRSPITHT